MSTKKTTKKKPVTKKKQAAAPLPSKLAAECTFWEREYLAAELKKVNES